MAFNSKYSGGRFLLERYSTRLAEVYPEGIYFTKEGFPDFSDQIVSIKGLPDIVELTELGKYSSWDIYHANNIANVSAA